ncbi:hypothetical protein ACFQ0K_06765 [Nocardioides caeni]|uniref:Type VII secretion integral membrane protein EccD n=1 Tax=Nocardioides caeni TaxID=574700 RepID=A0A4S8N934_9ACTN|nr:hypothetical protein [Nocardioides caeni]THV12880.1 hypothetical protein E9934_10825 [Nocardioides caeni]
MSGARSRTPSRTASTGAALALTVHGPAGVLDLTVPSAATLADVAQAYAAEVGLAAPLPFVSRMGEPLQLSTVLADAGITSGTVLVAVEPTSRPAPPGPGRGRAGGGRAPDGLRASTGSAIWLTLAAAAGLAAGWSAAQLPDDERWPAVVALLVAALVGCLPFGALAAQRVLAAPALAAAAALALVWDPTPERLPMVIGTMALASSVTAAVGRALADPVVLAEGVERAGGADEGLRVWICVGAAWFVVAGIGTLANAAPQVVWSVLLLLAVLAARFVPTYAVDVPDQYLLDLERLAVTAWSARERPTGRRGRIVVPERAVAGVAASGARLVRAAAAAILVVVLVTAPLLLWSADLPLDRTGARCLVGFGGAALLLAARSYRHVVARRLLRLAGVVALAWVAVVVLGIAGPGGAGTSPGWVRTVAIVALALAALLVLVAVLVGRGWRSAWWSRRAEIGEALCGAFAVGSLVVAVGFFRHLWEVTG